MEQAQVHAASDPRIAAAIAAAKADDAELRADDPTTAPGQPGEPAKGSALGNNQEGPGAPALPLDQSITLLVCDVRDVLGEFFPTVKLVLHEGKCQQLGVKLAPVARKYKWEAFFDGFAWREELQAVMAGVPTAFNVYRAVQHDIAELKKEAARAAPERTVGGTVTERSEAPASPRARDDGSASSAGALKPNT
jgi:hypothetical protein